MAGLISILTKSNPTHAASLDFVPKGKSPRALGFSLLARVDLLTVKEVHGRRSLGQASFLKEAPHLVSLGWPSDGHDLNLSLNLLQLLPGARNLLLNIATFQSSSLFF